MAHAREVDDLRVGTRVEIRMGMSRVVLLPDSPPQLTSDSTYQPVRSISSWARSGRDTITRLVNAVVVEREIRTGS
jgi:hypothetical protein